MSNHVNLATSLHEAEIHWESTTGSWKERLLEMEDSASSIEDEEEVLFDLDEEAMARLPRHLQENMLQIQLERLRRMQRENIDIQIRTRKPNRHNRCAQKWFINMTSRLAATQAMQSSRNLGATDSPLPQQVGWSRFRSQSLLQPQHEDAHFADQRGHRSVRSEVGLGNDSFSNYEILPGGHISPHLEYNRLPDQQYLQEPQKAGYRTRQIHADWYGGDVQEETRVRSRFHKKSPTTIISVVRGQLRKSVRKMSRFFNKQLSS